MPRSFKFVSTFCLKTFAATLLLAGCQTGRLHEISQIEKGMSKSKVLGIAGGPQRSERKHDQDVWIYIIPEERRDVLKEIDFADGRVSYVGDPIAPTGPSADEQDRINEESNAKSEAERRRDQLLENVGGSKSHRTSVSSEAVTTGSTPNAAAVDASVEDDEKPAAQKPVFIPLDGAAGSGQ